MAKNPSAQHIQTRIDYLKKHRPNDPEIARQQARLQAMGGLPAPGDAALNELPAAGPASGSANFGINTDQYTGPNAKVGGAPPSLNFNDPNFQRLQDSIFSELTRNLDQDYKQGRDELLASLSARGIPFSADPNSRYQQEIGRYDDNYQQTKLSAQNQALTGAVGTMIDLQKLTDADLDRMVAQGQITAQQKTAIQVARISANRTGAGSSQEEENTGFYS